MTEIEQRIESTDTTPNYSERVITPDDVARGVHRSFVGGKWDTLGLLQVNFLKAQGLRPDHKFLDVGCGSLRAGRRLVDELDPGNYYGIDANRTLIQAGYDAELSAEQRAKLPVQNLRANDRFDADFGVKFDMAIAQSVFTHISLNHIRLCLFRIAKSMRPGGQFYATFFEQGEDVPLDRIVKNVKERALFSERNAYWYYRSDLQWAARSGPWSFRYIGDWDHPVNQRMVEFTRLTDEEAAAAQDAQA